MKRLLIAAAMIAPAAQAQDVNAESLGYIAMCSHFLSEPAILDAALVQYEDQNPDKLSAEDMASLRTGMEAEPDLSDVEASPIVAATLSQMCGQIREMLLPG